MDKRLQLVQIIRQICAICVGKDAEFLYVKHMYGLKHNGEKIEEEYMLNIIADITKMMLGNQGKMVL